jgi:hypothetical protein
MHHANDNKFYTSTSDEGELSFTLCPLYRWGKSICYPLQKRLDEPVWTW